MNKTLTQCLTFTVTVSAMLIPFLLPSPLYPQLNSSSNEMLKDLDFIERTFTERYAPTEWKKNYSNWDLYEEITQAKSTIQQSPYMGLKDFWQLVNHLFHSTKDYHVNVSFFSTEEAHLPFSVHQADGKYYIAYIFKDFINEDFPFEIGDELISMDGIPVDEIIQQIILQNIGENSRETDISLASIRLTRRIGSHGVAVPFGNVVLTGKKKKGQLITYTTSWDYYAEEMMGFGPNCQALPPKKTEYLPLLRKQFLFPQFHQYLSKLHPKLENPEMLGARSSVIPPLGRFLWKSKDDSPFYSYGFRLPRKKVASYVRIPTFSPDDDPFNDHTIESCLEEFSKIIIASEKFADILIIDQTNNPGGNLGYLYLLLSMLTDKPLEVYPHRLKLTQEEVFLAVTKKPMIENLPEEWVGDFNTEMNEFTGATIFSLQKIVNYYDEVIKEWNAKHDFTKPIYLMGVSHITPHPKARFTKPIIVLTNQLNFSCADIFPDILQSSKRAVIFGAKTAGAGGAVESCSFPNSRGIDTISYTASIGLRKDGSYMENNGVTPDYLYNVTSEDLKNNYFNYTRHLIKTINDVLQFN